MKEWIFKEILFIIVFFLVAFVSCGLCYWVTKDINTSYLAGLIACMGSREVLENKK